MSVHICLFCFVSVRCHRRSKCCDVMDWTETDCVDIERRHNKQVRLANEILQIQRSLMFVLHRVRSTHNSRVFKRMPIEVHASSCRRPTVWHSLLVMSDCLMLVQVTSSHIGPPRVAWANMKWFDMIWSELRWPEVSWGDLRRLEVISGHFRWRRGWVSTTKLLAFRL